MEDELVVGLLLPGALDVVDLPLPEPNFGLLLLVLEPGLLLLLPEPNFGLLPVVGLLVDGLRLLAGGLLELGLLEPYFGLLELGLLEPYFGFELLGLEELGLELLGLLLELLRRWAKASSSTTLPTKARQSINASGLTCLNMYDSLLV